MSETLRLRSEIEKALEAANRAFEGYSLIAEGMANCHDSDPEYFRAIEDRAIGHGAIVHVLQWVLGHHNDRGIDQVWITEIQPGTSLVKVLHSSCPEEELHLCDLPN